MGQQQLLLVILVTILVGIATVVAMNVFGTSAEEANRDAVRQDLLQGATAAQGIWTKPEMLDGAGQDFTNLEDAVLLRRLGMPLSYASDEADDGTNENGTYSIAGETSASELILQGIPAGGSDNIFAVVCRDTERNWQVQLADSESPTPHPCP